MNLENFKGLETLQLGCRYNRRARNMFKGCLKPWDFVLFR